jgi:hypothetical protein
MVIWLFTEKRLSSFIELFNRIDQHSTGIDKLMNAIGYGLQQLPQK